MANTGYGNFTGSIIYYNTALFDANCSGFNASSSYNCVENSTFNPALNNITNAPGIISMDNPRLLRESICYNTGSSLTWLRSLTDLDGNPLVSSGRNADIGACTYQGDDAQTGSMTAAISASGDTALAGAGLVFTAATTGKISNELWDFGDGTTLTNAALVRHSWSAPGAYTVSLTVTNASGSVTTTADVTILAPVSYYVSPTGNDASAGTSWAGAKRTLQAAVDAAPIGATVWVTNGTYSTGGRPAGDQDTTNVVAVTKPVTLQSVNGPGLHIHCRQRRSAVVHPAWSAWSVPGRRSCLIGFTVTNGQARRPTNYDVSLTPGGNFGGGVYCESSSSIVSNCVIVGNAAFNGGAISGGSIYSSALRSNIAFINRVDTTGEMAAALITVESTVA